MCCPDKPGGSGNGSGIFKYYYQQFSKYLVIKTVYLVIFTGLAQVTLGRHFGESRGAKAIVAGIGFLLAVSLAAMETTMGFNITQFGPYAAAILVILAAAVFYKLLNALGVGGISSSRNRLRIRPCSYVFARVRRSRPPFWPP